MVADRLAIQTNLTGFGHVQPRDDLCEGRFAAPISANEKNDFSRAEGQIDWAQDEMAIFLFPMVGVNDTGQIQALEKQILFPPANRALLGRILGKRDA